MAPPKGLAQSEFMEYVKFGALKLVSIVSPLSELRIVHYLFFLDSLFAKEVYVKNS